MTIHPVTFHGNWRYDRAKKTEWFDGSVKPVRVGVYQRWYCDLQAYFCYWDGQVWSMGWYTAAKANYCRNFKSESQALPWRGLSENPENTK